MEDAFLARAQPADIGGTFVPLIDPSDLIVTEILAGRLKDVDDARGIWRAQRSVLDPDRIEELLRSLDEALGQSALVRSFEAIKRG